jgi:hypothetical protein
MQHDLRPGVCLVQGVVQSTDRAVVDVRGDNLALLIVIGKRKAQMVASPHLPDMRTGHGHLTAHRR